MFCESYAGEYDVLKDKYTTLKWRIVSKPGGATMRPDEFYDMAALEAQVEQGDNTSERPMWAEKGGIDFDGR